MGKAEGRVEGYLTSRAKEAGGMCFKLSASLLNGIPDRLVVLNGHTVFVETKAPKGRLDPLQVVRIDELRQRGAIVHVACTRDQIDGLIASLVGP